VRVAPLAVGEGEHAPVDVGHAVHAVELPGGGRGLRVAVPGDRHRGLEVEPQELLPVDLPAMGQMLREDRAAFAVADRLAFEHQAVERPLAEPAPGRFLEFEVNRQAT
jgi:hypothetical protein